MLNTLAEAVSLRPADNRWREALAGSTLIGIAVAIKSVLSKLDGDALRKLGSMLQTGGFVVAVVLFAALAHPKFADDKIWLGLIAMVGFVLWLAGYVLGGKESRKASAIDILVLLFFAANVVAACASHYLREALHGLTILFIYICSYFYLTAVLNGSPRRKLILLLVLVAVASAESLYGLYQYKIGVAPLATWEDPTVEVQGTRIFGTVKNPNLLAGYLILIAPLALGLGMAAVANRRYLLSIPAFLSAVLICIATVLTGSRGGFIAIGAAAAVAGLMVVAHLWRRQPKLRIPLIIACVVVPLLIVVSLHFLPTFEQRVTSIFAGREHSSNSYRMNVYHASLLMFKDNWWFGVGPGNQAFRMAYGLYMRSGFDALGTYCVPLEVAVESGIFSLVIFGLLILSLLARGHLAFWSQSSSYEKWLTALAVASLVGMTAQGLVDTVFYRPQVQFIFWLLVALIVTDNSTGTTNKGLTPLSASSQ